MTTATEVKPANGYQLVPIGKLQSNPNQPRQTWDNGDDEEGKTKLERLAESIKAEGILQPLVVTPKNGHYLIVCGERRYRAAKLVQLAELPCIVRANLDDKAILELSITENLQREDLTPIDEAKAIKALIDKCGYSQHQVSKRLGISVASVNIKLSLLNLTPDLQKDIKKGQLSETQGREIIRAANKVTPDKRNTVMQSIREKLAKAKAEKPNLSTKDVKTIAKHTVKTASTVKGTPAGHKPKAITPQEKQFASKFAKAITLVDKTLSQFAGVDSRFGDVIHQVTPKTADTLRKANQHTTKMLELVNEAKRRALASKIQ